MRRRFIQITLLLIGLTLLPGFVSLEAMFSPKADLWEKWQVHDPKSKLEIDHGAWQGLLTKLVVPYTDGINRVRYQHITKEDGAQLQSYLNHLRQLPISIYTRDEQRAYWVNLYNAATVFLVRQHYPVPSIRDIKIGGNWLSSGPWDRKLLEIEGEQLSLNDIEHRILRPIWRDPRIHYALNCASLGCPNLSTSAFTAANTEKLLNNGAADFINHPRAVGITDKGLNLSKIYLWFEGDFADEGKGVLGHLVKYAKPELADKLEQTPDIDTHSYDWSLNDAR